MLLILSGNYKFAEPAVMSDGAIVAKYTARLLVALLSEPCLDEILDV